MSKVSKDKAKSQSSIRIPQSPCPPVTRSQGSMGLQDIQGRESEE